MHDARQLIERNVALDKLDVHDHVALFYDNDQDKERILARLLRLACDRGEACIFHVSLEKEEIVKRLLNDAALRQECLSKGGRVAIIDPAIELGEERTASNMLRALGDSIDFAIDMGFNAAWVFTESDYLKKLLPENEFIMYESLSNEIFEEKNALGICVIDSLSGKSTIMNSIMTHPTFIIKGYVCRNHFYMDPEECSKAGSGPPAMNFILEKMLDIQISELNGIESDEDLRVLNTKLQSEVDRRMMVEWALLRSENEHKTAINAIEEMILVTDRDNKVLLVNDAFLDEMDFIGHNGGVIGEDIYDLMPYIKGSQIDNFSEVIELGRTSLREGRFIFHGNELILEVRKVPIMDGESVGRVLSVIRDVTDQRKTRDELVRLREHLSKLTKKQAKEIISLREHFTIEQERRILAEGRLLSLVRILERSKISIFVGDRDRHVIYANPACCDAMGYEKGEIERIDLLELFVPSERTMVEGIISEMSTQEEVGFMAEAQRKDGSNRPCALNVIRIDQDGYMLVIMTEAMQGDAWAASIGAI